MVSAKVMILCILSVLAIIAGMIPFNTGNSQKDANETTSMKNENQSQMYQTVDIITNPNFVFFNESTGLPSNWADPAKSCMSTFSCTIKFTDGWNDFVSFAMSTTKNTNNTWASIQSQQMTVSPGENFQVVSHMKLNQWATQSHVVLEGYDETSEQWKALTHCPSGVNGPIEWQEFSCTISIPENITKIRAVLKAGWSSQPNMEATTWFDSVDVLGSAPVLTN